MPGLIGWALGRGVGQFGILEVTGYPKVFAREQYWGVSSTVGAIYISSFINRVMLESPALPSHINRDNIIGNSVMTAISRCAVLPAL